MLDAVRHRPWAFAAALSALLLVANLVVEPSFGSPSNWPGELATLAPFALVAMASTPSILSGGGGLDISVGPVAVLVNVIAVAWLLPTDGLESAWVGVPILLAVGAVVGLANGLLIAVFRYWPVIATLCMFFILAGVIQMIAPQPRSAPAHNWTVDLADQVGPIPGGLILIALPLAAWFVLSRTAYHRNLYATGGSDATAYSTGVDVTAVRVLAYALGGMFAAVAGIALTALVQSTQAGSFSQYTLIAFAAVALGGTQLGGGRGGLVASLLGAVAIYLMQTLLGAADVSSAWLNFVYGTLLVAGVIVGARLAAPRVAEAPA